MDSPEALEQPCLEAGACEDQLEDEGAEGLLYDAVEDSAIPLDPGGRGASPEGTPCVLCQRPLEPLEQRLRHLLDRPLCNTCCFRDMDPFKPVELEHVLFMSVLPGRHLTFTLEVPDLRMWRKEGFEVEFRGLRRRSQMEPQGLQQVWPSFLSIEVNGHEVFTTKVPLRGHKRRDVPQGLSASLRRGINTLEVTAEDERRRDFLLAVVRTLPLKPCELATAVVEETYQDCRQRVEELLREVSRGPNAAGEEVERVGEERLKLQCPIALTRPATRPVRGVSCRHFQCVDLEAYLISNFRMRAFNSRWRCPLCSLEVRPRDLRIDTFVQMLLAETEPEVEEVLLFPDGSWQKGEAVEREPSRSSSPARARANPLVEVADAKKALPKRRAKAQGQGEDTKVRRRRKRKNEAAGEAPKKVRRGSKGVRAFAGWTLGNGVAQAAWPSIEAKAPSARKGAAPGPGFGPGLARGRLGGVRRLAPAARRAMAIAAGRNVSVGPGPREPGVDSDASAEVVSDSGSEAGGQAIARLSQSPQWPL
ncbi:unnamed protein product [Effrenium voratum]|uniref:SP-RING-type domain-containing protein n=1 Tax=Effrenium voratum TaxID=2562239 RepID=A0AA36IW18_9DINO|nr:unnamed protein product [Effrenium voratum]